MLSPYFILFYTFLLIAHSLPGNMLRIGLKMAKEADPIPALKNTMKNKSVYSLTHIYVKLLGFLVKILHHLGGFLLYLTSSLRWHLTLRLTLISVS